MRLARRRGLSPSAFALSVLIAAGATATGESLIYSSVRQVDFPSLSAAEGVAVGVDGTLFVADTQNHRVLAMELDGSTRVLAGNGKPGFKDGEGAAAQFAFPAGIAFDRWRNLVWVSDTGNNAIRRIELSGHVTTVAGQKKPGFRDGAGSLATFHQPRGLAVDRDGSVFVADSLNHAIRVIRPEGSVAVYASSRGTPGFVNGPALQSQFHEPWDVSILDRDLGERSLLVADRLNNAIRFIDLATANVSTLTGSGQVGFFDGSMVAALFFHPTGVAAWGRNVWVADRGNHAIRSIDLDAAEVSTLGGSGKPGNRVGPLAQTQFKFPTGLTFEGALWIADAGNNAVKVTYPTPFISSVSPSEGPQAGGTLVEVSGLGFVPGSSVALGLNSAAGTYVDPSSFRAITPQGFGTVDVAITTPEGKAVLENGFRYGPALVNLRIDPAMRSMILEESAEFEAIAIYSDGSSAEVTSLANWTSSEPEIAAVTAPGSVIARATGEALLSARFLDFEAAARIVITDDELLPPDLSVVSSPIDPTVATEIADATRFLYEGPGAIQLGVESGAIDDIRVAILRGRVIDRTGTQLTGVTVRILHHPEFGITSTRASGIFEMAVNGGGTLTLVFSKQGYLPVQRSVVAPWRDYGLVRDVALTALDANVTAIALASNESQVAAGATVEDMDGRRTAVVIVPAGTTADIVLPDGSRQPVSELHLRATEYTLGEDGAAAMPAELPPTSGFTYCVELSADEAIAVDARAVEFSQPVPLYVDNFLDFPVGSPVPAGYYDRGRGEWLALENGRVIAILPGAGIDLDGNGSPESDTDLLAAGISVTERELITTRYEAGTELWRVALRHFSPIDLNWPVGPPPNANAPNLPDCNIEDPYSECATAVGGSIIRCENQTLAEVVPIEGTAMALVYNSDRVPGRKGASTLDIPVTGDTIPASVKRIVVQIIVAGRAFRREFAPVPRQSFEWSWDGRDAWGRPVRGRHEVTVSRSFVYDAFYLQPSAALRAFAELSGVGVPVGPARREIELQQSWKGHIGVAVAETSGLGAWTISGHHHFDATSRELISGSGIRTGGFEALKSTLRRVGFISQANGVDVAPDGSLFIAAGVNVWKIDRDGNRIHVAGNGSSAYNGDGIPATSASLWGASDVAVAADGSIYVSERFGLRVRRIDRNGVIWTVAGTGQEGSDRRDGEGGPATSANLKQVLSLAIGPDGALYLGMDHVVRRVSPAGTITTLIGGSGLSQEDGIPAWRGHVGPVYGIAVATDGTIYFADTLSHRIRAIGPDGIVRILAGNGSQLSKTTAASLLTADTEPLETSLDSPMAVAVGRDGSVYFSDRNCLLPQCNPSGTFGFIGVIRRITPEQVLAFASGPVRPGGGFDVKAVDAMQYRNPQGLATSPSGALFIANAFGSTIWKLDSAFPGFDPDAMIVPESSGSFFHVFDRSGRHLATRDISLNTSHTEFGYDSAGRLIAIADRNGRVTTVERAGALATSVIAPGGKRTTFEWNGDGLLESVTAPGGRITSFSYTADGLMRSMTDPRSGTSRFEYDGMGRLVRDTDAAGGSKSLSLSEGSDGFAVILRDAAHRQSRYEIERLEDGSERQTITDPAGLSTVTFRAPSETVVDLPDGSRSRLTKTPDPLLAMMAPQQSAEITTPGGRRLALWFSRGYDGSSPGSVTATYDQIGIDSRYWQIELDAATRTRKKRSPMGRKSEELFDAAGRLAEVRAMGVAPTTFVWNSAGKLRSVAQNGQGYSFEWNAADELVSITDPLGRSVGFAYDTAGRVIEQRLPDGRVIGFNYDLNDNLISLTPPGRPAHGFDYSSVNLETAYRPPPVSGSDVTMTRYEYNLARALTKVIRPDGLAIGLVYDGAGRLASLTTPSGTSSYAYRSDGNLRSISAPGGVTLNYGWDAFLLTAVQWSGVITGEVAWTYDDSFLVTSERVNGSPIDFAYDLDSLMTTAGGMTIRRDPANGRITGATLGRTVDTYTHHPDGSLVTYAMRDMSTEVLRLEFTRDAIGRIVEKKESRFGVTLLEAYGYDAAGRLTTVHRNGELASRYEYDANGNRLSKITLSTVETGTYDDQDRMLTYAGASYAYSANGELRTKTDVSGTTRYDYDLLGNLRRVDLPDGTLVEYVIDGQNRRVGKKVNGSLVRGWLYGDQLNPVAELDGAGNVVSRFVYGTRSNVPDYMIRGGVHYRIVADELGSVRYVIDISTGAIVQAIDYDEFGIVIQDNNSSFQPFRFAGGLFDPATDLVRFGARDYSPKNGRWTTKDPIRFAAGDGNLFSYVFSDPINAIDPSGLLGCSCSSSSSFGQRVWQNFVTTNDAIPGLAPGVTAITGRTVANATGTTTMYQWASSGFRGARLGGVVFTATETGILAGLSTAINFGAAVIAFEAGIMIGSVVNVGVHELVEAINCPCDPGPESGDEFKCQ